MCKIANVALVLVTTAICYGLLILGDWQLEKVVTGKIDAGREQISEIESRRELDDIYLKQQALSDGYTGLRYPFYFDNQFSNQMKKSGIGLIGGKPHAKTYFCNEGAGLVKYVTDRFGLRNEDENWEKDIDTIFIGDSAVHGACVHNHEVISSYYTEITGKTSLNLGTAASNPKHYSLRSLT